MNKPTVIITHHTGGTDANPRADTSHHTVEIIDQSHKTRWPEFVSARGYWCGYHFFIDKTGKVTQTRDYTEEGAHTIGMNSSSIGVCFAGNFDVTVPTDAQLNAWFKLYDELLRRYPNIPTYPHRKYATKTCHGRLLSDDYFAVQAQINTLKIRIAQLKAQLLNMVTRRRQK